MKLPARVLLLSAVALQACLNATKTVASAPHHLSASFHENGSTRNLRMASMDPETKGVDNIEERGPGLLPLAKLADKDNVSMLTNEIVATRDTKTALVATTSKTTEGEDHGKAAAGMRSTLSDEFRGDNSQTFLNRLKKENNAVLALEAQIKDWAEMKETVTTIFRYLKLNEKGVEIWKEPSLPTFLAYVAKIHPSRDKFALLFGMVMYHTSDRKYVIFILNEIMFAPARRELAVKYLNRKFDYWTKHGRAPDAVYNALGLNQDKEPLSNPLLLVWLLYAQKARIDPVFALFHNLRKNFKSDDILNESVAVFNEKVTKGSFVESAFMDALSNERSGDDIAKLFDPAVNAVRHPLRPPPASFLTA